jgi:hypothetical protein
MVEVMQLIYNVRLFRIDTVNPPTNNEYILTKMKTNKQTNYNPKTYAFYDFKSKDTHKFTKRWKKIFHGNSN